MARILVVEDDKDLLFLYEVTLNRHGHMVTKAPHVADALLYLTNDEFDVVILDMNMPDMPGIRVIEFARDDVRLRHVPIIVLSANAQWKATVSELGVPDFLIKPVPMRELLAHIEDALRRSPPHAT